jgi:hypothetical protein
MVNVTQNFKKFCTNTYILAKGNIGIPIEILDFICSEVKQILVKFLNVGMC